MTTKERRYKRNRYSIIVAEKQGKKFIYDEENIKREQCTDCVKANTIRCRLNIRDNKCINYSKRND